MRPLGETNPAAVMLYYLLVTGITMFTMNPVVIAGSFLFALVVFLLTDRKGGFRQHIPYIILGIVLAFINPLVYHNGVTVLLVLNDNPITLEALIYGIVASAKILAALYWFRSFSLIMSEDKLLYCFGSISPKSAQLLSMVLRFVPLFRKKMQEVNRSQKAVGLYKDDNLIDHIRNGLRIFSIMVTWALENGIITADSMTARGYGTGRRSYFSFYRFRRSDGWFVLLLLLFSVPVIVLLGRKTGEIIYYPELILPASGPASLWLYLSFLCLCALPVVLYLEDKLSWKYYLSKI
ncbi:MAG: cobalt transport protein [Lachnospiraceae bacterium]|nr:cobalt transport protein [Lachnospiraceae bacterium]